jgi:hypothetical protein
MPGEGNLDSRRRQFAVDVCVGLLFSSKPQQGHHSERGCVTRGAAVYVKSGGTNTSSVDNGRQQLVA